MKLYSIANLTLAALVLGVCGTAANADSIYLRSGPQAAELELKNVTFSKVKDGEIYYTVGTREAHRAIAETRLEVTGENQFNAAEKAFSEAALIKDDAAAKAKYSSAVDGYTATMGATNKPWLKDFVTLRMQVAAPKSGRLDEAIKAWMMMVDRDPAAAAKAKPSLTGIDSKSAYLSNAAKLLSAAEKGAAKPEVRRAYLDLLGDIQSAMGDLEGANKTREARVALGGSPEEIAEVSVRIAQADAAAKKFDAAMNRLKNVNLSALPDSVRADAMYVIAECKSAKLQPNSPPDEWKDAAIDYMKVVAGFPASANTPEALLRVAEIHETLKDPETALKIYQQVAREHAETPAGQAAQKSIQRLGKTASRG